MPSDPYYKSRHWLALRQAALIRDLYRCAVPGCRDQAKVVDHIVARRAGGADTLDNVRCMCKLHDNQIKERSDGTRKKGGSAHVVGCDANGWPLDPGHDWNNSK